MWLEIGMVPKKPELLDLLRQRNDGGSSAPKGERSASDQPPTVPSQPVSPSEPMRLANLRPTKARFPWLPAAVVLMVAAPLAWLTYDWAFAEQAVVAAEEPNAPAQAPALEVKSPIAAVTPVVVAARQPVVTTPAPKAYGVKVITYTNNQKNLGLARAVGKALKSRGMPEVQLLGVQGRGGNFLEIFVGREANVQDLAKLKGTIRVYEYPDGSGQKPFASAMISSLPPTNNN